MDVKVEVINEMPPYFKLAEFLWGKNVDIDSDGNSDNPDSTDWNELTLILRKDESQRLDIDPVDQNYISIRSDRSELVEKTIFFLRKSGSIK